MYYLVFIVNIPNDIKSIQLENLCTAKIPPISYRPLKIPSSAEHSLTHDAITPPQPAVSLSNPPVALVRRSSCPS